MFQIVQPNIVLHLIFGFLVFINFQDCGGGNKVLKNTEPSKIISGNFSGDTPKSPGFLKLEIKSDGSALFLNVVTVHLPPAEIERLETKVKENKGTICFETKPQTVEQCAVSASEREIVLKLLSDNSEIKLKRVE